MNLPKIFFKIALCLLFIMGCKDTEPTGGATYYIDNQSGYDLVVEFPVSLFDLKADAWISKDSMVTVSKLSLFKLYEDLGHFGLNPTPKHSFSEIRFYKRLNGNKDLALELKPVGNDRWRAEIVSRSKGYGLTEYYLKIKDSDLQ